MAMSERVERLETFLMDYDKTDESFTVYEYREAADIETASEASGDIQLHLAAQRRGEEDLLYVLRRDPDTRTSTARWLVGDRSKDARGIGNTLLQDTEVKIMRGFRPDLEAIKRSNPRAGRLVERQIHAVVQGAMAMLAMAVTGMEGGEE